MGNRPQQHTRMHRDRATPDCHAGRHTDREGSGLCDDCALILDAAPDTNPHRVRQSYGWPAVPLKEITTMAQQPPTPKPTPTPPPVPIPTPDPVPNPPTPPDSGRPVA